MVYDDPVRIDRIMRETLGALWRVVSRDYTKEGKDPLVSSHLRRIDAGLDLEDEAYHFELAFDHNFQNRDVPLPVLYLSGHLAHLVDPGIGRPHVTGTEIEDELVRLRNGLVEVMMAVEGSSRSLEEQVLECRTAARRALGVDDVGQALDRY